MSKKISIETREFLNWLWNTPTINLLRISNRYMKEHEGETRWEKRIKKIKMNI